MRFIILVFIFLVSQLSADLDEFGRKLMSDDFKVRQRAENEIVQWAREEDKDARAEALFQRYLKSEDPEEFHRLTKVLLKVHFELKKSTIPQTGPGFMGIQMFTGVRRPFEQGRLQAIEEPQEGVIVSAVIEGTPAKRAGLQVGDLITEIDGASIAGGSPRLNLIEIVGSKLPGTTVNLTVLRDERQLAVKVTLMNGKAVTSVRVDPDEARVDFEMAEKLLQEDYLRWLVEQRKAVKGPSD